MNRLLEDALGYARTASEGGAALVMHDTAFVLQGILLSGQPHADRVHVSDMEVLASSIEVALDLLSLNLDRPWRLYPQPMSLGEALHALAGDLPKVEPSRGDYLRVGGVISRLRHCTHHWRSIGPFLKETL